MLPDPNPDLHLGPAEPDPAYFTKTLQVIKLKILGQSYCSRIPYVNLKFVFYKLGRVLGVGLGSGKP
jgi:hypothetical protein